MARWWHKGLYDTQERAEQHRTKNIGLGRHCSSRPPFLVVGGFVAGLCCWIGTAPMVWATMTMTKTTTTTTTTMVMNLENVPARRENHDDKDKPTGATDEKRHKNREKGEKRQHHHQHLVGHPRTRDVSYSFPHRTNYRILFEYCVRCPFGTKTE